MKIILIIKTEHVWGIVFHHLVHVIMLQWLAEM